MQTPLDYRPIITAADIYRGYVVRYFAQFTSTKKIYEINQEQYNIFRKDPYYVTTKIPWVIRSSNAAEQNSSIVELYNKRLGGLRFKLKNFSEYTIPVVPPTIYTEYPPTQINPPADYIDYIDYGDVGEIPVGELALYRTSLGYIIGHGPPIDVADGNIINYKYNTGSIDWGLSSWSTIGEPGLGVYNTAYGSVGTLPFEPNMNIGYAFKTDCAADPVANLDIGMRRNVTVKATIYPGGAAVQIRKALSALEPGIWDVGGDFYASIDGGPANLSFSNLKLLYNSTQSINMGTTFQRIGGVYATEGITETNFNECYIPADISSVTNRLGESKDIDAGYFVGNKTQQDIVASVETNVVTFYNKTYDALYEISLNCNPAPGYVAWLAPQGICLNDPTGDDAPQSGGGTATGIIRLYAMTGRYITVNGPTYVPTFPWGARVLDVNNNILTSASQSNGITKLDTIRLSHPDVKTLQILNTHTGEIIESATPSETLWGGDEWTFTYQASPLKTDIISSGLELTRPYSSSGFINTASESSWNSGSSPVGTLWNSVFSPAVVVSDSVDTNLTLDRFTGAYDYLYNSDLDEYFDVNVSPSGTLWNVPSDSAWLYSPLLNQKYDVVGTGLTLTRGYGGQLYNSQTNNFATPQGTSWTSGIVSEYPLVLDYVDTGLILARKGSGWIDGGGALFNSASESAWDFGTNNPAGTEWNSIYTDAVNYGWNDLTNVTTRTYDTLYNALNQNVGNNIVPTQLIMHDTINDKYYKFDVTQWGQGGTGTFAYSRQQINTATGTLIGSPTVVTQSFWGNMSDVTSRNYTTFTGALGGLYQYDNRAVPTELIMKDTINNKYYKFDIIVWNDGTDGGTYSYTRQEINSATGVLTGPITTITRTSSDVNNDGWSDLSNVTSRGYTTFWNIISGDVETNLLNVNMVMRDYINNKYYTFKFNNWTNSDSGSKYSYTRQEINTATGTIIGSPVTIAKVSNTGWDDLVGVQNRNYSTFYEALNSNIDANATSSQLVMWDTADDKYYKFDITEWSSINNGATYAYTRQRINTGSGELIGTLRSSSRNYSY